MTELDRRALAAVPLPRDVVESLFDLPKHGSPLSTIRELCVSHERLRHELEGAELLLRARLAAALALTDTGSVAFREAFRAVAPGEIIPGWVVVGRIRAVLLEGQA